MKLQVSQPAGAPHQVELPGPQVVVGRDPSCDLVLNDERCSRRHAVIEDGPEGLTIQDAGSSNGMRVNGRRLQRSRLRPGDEVRLGDTVITVLSEAARTVLTSAAELRADLEPSRPRLPTAPPRPRRVSRPAPSADSATITLLTVLWALWTPTAVVGGVVVALRAQGSPVVAALAMAAGLILGALGAIMAIGLRARAPWARQLQIVAAGGGLVVCPLAFASLTVLIYMLRDDVKAAFEGGRGTGAGDAELTFALSLLGMLALGLILSALGFLLLSPP